MSPIETQDISSEDTVPASNDDNTKLVPVAESIRYRKRAQSAEKKIEELSNWPRQKHKRQSFPIN